MSEESRRAFAEAVRAPTPDLAAVCTLIAAEADPDVDPGADVPRTRGLLADLAALVVKAPPASTDDATRPHASGAAQLRAVLGGPTGFSGSPEAYADLRSSLLPEVLRRRRGLPILLSVVWLETARLAGLPAYGTSLPGHFIVGIGTPAGPHQLVDPYRGGAAVDEPPPDPLPAWEPLDMVNRILANIRGWAGNQPDRLPTRLWAVELTLLLPRHAVELRRERGELLVRRGDFTAGADDLDQYADIVDPAAPEIAELARQHARMARARLN